MSATNRIPKFLNNRHRFAPSEYSQEFIKSNNGGNTKAKAVEHRAPISDMKTFNCGTKPAIATAIDS